jgi:hypothetical protein
MLMGPARPCVHSRQHTQRSPSELTIRTAHVLANASQQPALCQATAVVNVQTISGDAEGQARTTLSASPEMTKESIDSAAISIPESRIFQGRMKS